MTPAPDFQPQDRDLRERVGQPVILVILLDVLTLGIYSVARSYWVHAALVKETGRRLFADGFLHVLLLLNLALLVLRFSRDAQPLDSTVIFTRFGAALLFISLLLIFRRCLREHFHLHIRTLPLALFGFWYLQYRLNRLARKRSTENVPSLSAGSGALAVSLYVGVGLLLGCFKQFSVPSPAMEPTLTVGDRLIIDELSYSLLSKPDRADLLVFTSPQNRKTAYVKRVLGLPGDRISFRPDSIQINDVPLDCQRTPAVDAVPDVMDKSPKHAYSCSLNGKTFSLHHYQQGPLTAVFGDFVVPEHHYFMVGDNLDNSADSRTFGSIPAHFVIGRALYRTFSYRLGEPIPWHRWFHSL